MDNYLNKISELKSRTKRFCIDVIRYVSQLPKSDAIFVISKQLLKSATSVAANYRAMCRSRSESEKYSKNCIVVEESDEALFWLELILESGLDNSEELKRLTRESEELTKIFNSTKYKIKTNISK